jgi:hypothetical protein
MNYRKVALLSSVLITGLIASFLPFSGGAVAVPSGGSPPTGYTSVPNDIQWYSGGVPELGNQTALVVNAEVGIGRKASANERYRIRDGRDASFTELYSGPDWYSDFYATSIAFGDVDGDGLDEVGIARKADVHQRYQILDDAEADDPFSVLYEGGGGEDGLPPWSPDYYATCIAFGDVDGDGLDEVGIARYALGGMRYRILDDALAGFSMLHEEDHWLSDYYANCIAFGDVDGDGFDEVGIAIRAGGGAGGGIRYQILDDAKADDPFSTIHEGGSGWDNTYFVTCIAFGDVDSDGLDEVGITRCADWGMRYRILDDAEADDPFSMLHEESGWDDGNFATWIAFGDVDLDGYDEVGITRYAHGGWRCKILDDAASYFGQLASWGQKDAQNEGWGSDTYATSIAFGDVDFDGLDEIGIARYREIEGQPCYWIQDDRYNDFGQLFEGGTKWGDHNYATSIAFGDVDGGSLIIGEPMHSVQTIDDQLSVVINAPPKQSGVNFEDGKYTATYKSSVQNQVIQSVKATTGFAFTTSFKARAGVENVAQATFELTSQFGRKFERESVTGYTTEFDITRYADTHDIYLGVKTVYDVYEYKVLSPPDEAIIDGEQQRLVITIPQSAPSKTNGNWDGGNHVQGDILTYPSTYSQLLRYDASHLIWKFGEQHIDGEAGGDSFTEKVNLTDKSKDTSSLKLSMKTGLNIGTKACGVEFSFQGDYESEEIVTHETSLTEETCISVDYVGAITDPWKYYTVEPVLYYDNEFGYLVLDYVVTDLGFHYQFLPLWRMITADQERLEAALESGWWQNTWQSSIGGTVLVVDDRFVSSCITTQIPIRIENAEDIESMRITLPYDPDILSPTEVSKGTLTAESSLEWDVGDGTIQIALEDSAGINGNGSIATIGFEVVGSPGDYYTLAPTVSANEGTSQEDESIAVRSGLFLVKSIEEIRGDCDGDGDIDSVDALLALKMSEGKIEVNLVGDMNEDDQVTPSDATEMLSMGARKAVTDFYCRLQGIVKGIKPRTET